MSFIPKQFVLPVVLTAWRPQHQTLVHSLKALQAAGFVEASVFSEPLPPDVKHPQQEFRNVLWHYNNKLAGPFFSFRSAVSTVLNRDPGVDYLLVCEDDLDCHPGTARYLDELLSQTPLGADVGVLSLYVQSLITDSLGDGDEVADISYARFSKLRAVYEDGRRVTTDISRLLQVHPSMLRRRYCGAVAMLLPRRSAEDYLAYTKTNAHFHGSDIGLAHWCRDAHRRYLYHNPSLFLHTGNGNSTVDDDRDESPDRQCDVAAYNNWKGIDTCGGTV